MKTLISFVLFCLSFISYGQVTCDKPDKFILLKYAGIYSYGKDIEKGRIGSVIIYPETDTTLLFYMDLNRGAPSYNLGSLYGRVKISNGTGIFYQRFDSVQNSCKLTFKFSKNILTIISPVDQNNCGFGFGVYANGDYKQKSNKTMEYFVDLEEKKVFFKSTKPEDYYSK